MTDSRNKKILMIAFEFPPSNGASVQRILSVYRAFAQNGWHIDVLSVNEKAYADGNTVGGVSLSEQELHGDLIRPMAYDVQRDFAWNGKYIGCLMTPDRWGLTWVPNARKALKEYLRKNGNPDVIWSTAPISSVHLVGYMAHSMSKSPWLADYRDPMPYLHKDLPWYQRVTQRFIDKKVIENASHVTFATSHVRDMYKELGLEESNTTIVSNGFVKSNFDKASTLNSQAGLFNHSRFSIYYSGVLYESGRCPLDVFLALKKWNFENPTKVAEIVFQGVSEPEPYILMADSLSVSEFVKFAPKTNYFQSLKNMQDADALLLIQDSQFENQIPGKLYEYLYTELPILIKSPEHSATAKQAEQFSGVCIAEKGMDFYDAFVKVIAMPRELDRPAIALKKLSRETQVEQLVKIAQSYCAHSTIKR